MKRRVRKIANFFAFNLLFFALYLNFIHKDNVTVSATADQSSVQGKSAFSRTVLVETTDVKPETAVSVQPAVEKTTEVEASTTKLSIN